MHYQLRKEWLFLKINIPITNGTGSSPLTNGSYTASAIVNGYDNASIEPKSVTIEEGVTTYEFQISANGSLTLHVTETGEAAGTIVNATFIRCDESGNTYGTEIVTNEQGNAIFPNVPYSNEKPITLYYKQTKSDNKHTFDNTLKSISLSEQNTTIEIANPLAPTRTINLVDANYENLKINGGTITLE